MSRFGKPNPMQPSPVQQSAVAPPMQAQPANQPKPALPNKPKYGKGSDKRNGMGNPHAKGAGTMPC